MGMKYHSPYTNMFIEACDFNKMIKHIEHYLSLPIEFDSFAVNEDSGGKYPVGRLGEIRINFNHYTDFDCVRAC